MQRILEEGRHPDLRWPDFHPSQDAVQDFYARLGAGLGWVRDRRPTPQARAMATLLERAEQKGLAPDDYDGPRWAERLARLGSATDAELAAFDTALTVSAVRYVRALQVGRVSPKALGLKLNVWDVKHDVGEFLHDHVVASDDVPTAVGALEPSYPGYRRTLEALGRYRTLAGVDTGAPLALPAKPIAPGKTYEDLPGLALRLRVVGDLPESAPLDPGSRAYEGAVVEAVRRFQARHGQRPDGALRAEVVKELNVPLDRRVRQMELTP